MTPSDANAPLTPPVPDPALNCAAAVFVAVGGLASRRASLQGLFSGILPANASFVVVLRPDTAMDELASVAADLQQWSGLPAHVIDTDTPLAPGLILVPRHHIIAVVEGDQLRLRPEAENEDGILDSLALSLAIEKQDAAVLVVLDGLGHEGTLGTTSIKQHGGLTLIEQADGLQDLAGDIADLVLPADQIGGHIQAHAAFLHGLRDTPDQAGEVPLLRTVLDRIAQTLQTRTGHDFHGYKQATFLRRVTRRMQVLQIPDPAGYADVLRDSPGEVQHLFQDLLIGVTRFFRDRAEFDVLARDVVPGLFAGKGRGTTIRVWTLGCATGEEAYSLAILLREHAATLEAPPAIQIFATDIDGRALASARAGRFADSIDRDVSPERLARWFVREGNTYAVAKTLREMCVFSAHNILRDPPFSRIDLVSCRNLLIYLNTDMQDRVVPLFHFALRAGGVVFLGPSENISRQTHLFAPIDRRHRIFRRLEAPGVPLPTLPVMARAASETMTPLSLRQRGRDGSDLITLAERLVRRHAPAYVVVNPGGDVLHFSDRMGRFLSPSPGVASLNLVNLVYRELRPELRTLLQRASGNVRTEMAERLAVVLDSGPSLVTLIAEPLVRPGDDVPSLVVTFHDVLDDWRQAGPASADSIPQDGHTQRVESELRLVKGHLQAALQEQETTSEELKASNEEYQSINEELQSANEELETSKEELQSVNEELQTVNSELDNRIHELAHINSDLRNVLESTQIAVMFLDNDLRIKSFTPALKAVFHLLESDKGRPITHIGVRVNYPELADDVNTVLRTLSPAEREVGEPESGRRYLIRVLPYRSVDNVIAGAVVTFLDITATARAEDALRVSEERFRRMAASVPVFLFIATPDLGWDYVNPPFYDYTGFAAGAASGTGWLRAVHPDDVDQIQSQWHGTTNPDAVFERELRINSAAGDARWFLVRAVPQTDGAGKVTGWFGSAIDIHERRGGEVRQRLLLAELQHRVKNILAVVRSVVTRTRETSGSLDEFSSHLSGRIGALARTQGVLSRSADTGVGLEELLDDELGAHGGQDSQQVEMSGPRVMLSGRIAETLGLALHELTTNSLKYGALANAGGTVKVSWRVVPGASRHDRADWLTLDWQEFGVKLTDLRPTRSGFGRELIERGLPYDLGAITALTFRPGGVRCTIEVALSPVGEDHASFLSGNAS